MFNMCLLPESNGLSTLLPTLDSSVASGMTNAEDRPYISMVYPYDLLNNFYRQKREQFFEADRKYCQSSPSWNSCSMLYIDSLIHRECGGVGLNRDWRDDGGTGLYPPRSLQSMLRVLLLPNVSVESKYSLFMYLFMDLNVVYQDHECHPLVQNLYKFPTAFKMSKELIKTIESFWHLDHNNFEEAMVDFRASSMSKWQLELMVECLFLHQWPQLSLRALQMPGPSVSPVIELRVLLGNNLISEAFLFQKKHGDKSLLLEFFNSCYKLGNLRSILKLPLTETEGQLLGQFLLSVDESMPRNLHFVYLLQRSKYVEAVDLVDNLRLKRQKQQTIDTGSVAAVLSTYKATMPPIYQEMSEVYSKTANANNRNSMSYSQMNQSETGLMVTPLSSQLIRNKVDVNSSLYQIAITAVKEATNFSLFQGNVTQQANQSIMSPNKFTSIPFLRKPLQETLYDHETSAVVYPKVVDGALGENKRKNANDTASDDHHTKRRKLDSINVSLLTTFEPTKVERLSEFSLRKDNKNSSILSTPIVKRVANLNPANVSPSAMAGKMTPHSILKARNIFRDSPGPEERVLRFKQTSVSPSVFEVSAIKKPSEPRRSLDGPKARRSIRSLTPEGNFLSSTRNQIDMEETRLGGNKLADLEMEIKNKMAQVATEELQANESRKKLPLSEDSHSNKETLDTESDEGDEQKNKKYAPIMPRRSLRSRTPEQMSSPRSTVTRSATKKTLTRMVLESNAKKNLMERQEDVLKEADEPSIEVSVNNNTLDSTMAMSEYSFNLGVDPLAMNKTMLADNSTVSDSLLDQWKEKVRGLNNTTMDSVVSDTSEMQSIGDVLVDTPNQSIQFVTPEQVSINNTLEEEMHNKLNEVDQLQEDTVYEPQVETEPSCPVDVEKKEVEEPPVEEVPTPESPKTPQSEEVTFKVPTPPQAKHYSPKTPFLAQQETFIVSAPSKYDEAELDSPEIEQDEEEEEVQVDDEDDDYDESDLSNKTEASDESHKLEDDFPGNSDESLNDDDDYSDSSSEYSEDQPEPKAKPFKTNEVIDLLDSDDEEGSNSKSNETGDSNATNSGDDVQNDFEDEVQQTEEVEEYVPTYPVVANLEYGETFSIEKPLTEPMVANDPKEVGDVVTEDGTKSTVNVQDQVPEFDVEPHVDSPQKMDEDEPAAEEANIYDDMEVDVANEDEEESNGLNDALVADEDSKDADMCLRIDEDSQPATGVDSTVNVLNQAVVMEETVSEVPEAEVQQEELVEEVVEIIPPPKVAYETTEKLKNEAVVEPVQVVSENEQVIDNLNEEKNSSNIEEKADAVSKEVPVEPEEIKPENELPKDPAAVQTDDVAPETPTELVPQVEAVESPQSEDKKDSEVETNTEQPPTVGSSEAELNASRRRTTRAVSQPRHSINVEEVAAKIRSRRATSEAVEPTGSAGTPKRRMSHLLEQGSSEERLTPTLRMTPMRLARMNESTENLTTLGTPTRRKTRATSIESDISAARTPTTRGNARGRSKATADPEEDDDNVSVTSNASRRSLRSRKSVTADDNDDAKSTVSSSSATGRKGTTARARKTLIATAIPEEPEMADYSSSRRLTRHQQQMMERSLKVQNRSLDMTSSSISPGTPPVDESFDSDADSVSSKLSRSSPKRRSVRGVSKEVNTTCQAGVCECSRENNRSVREDSVNAQSNGDEDIHWRGLGAIRDGSSQMTEFQITLRFRVTSASQVQVHAVPEARE